MRDRNLELKVESTLSSHVDYCQDTLITAGMELGQRLIPSVSYKADRERRAPTLLSSRPDITQWLPPLCSADRQT